MKIYTCRSKDNLYNIARRFELDPAELAKINRLSLSQPLSEGLTLIVPTADYNFKSPAQLFLHTGHHTPDSLAEQFFPMLTAMNCSESDCTALRAAGVLPLMVLSNHKNGSFDTDFVHDIVKDSSARCRFAEEKLEALLSGGHGGLSLQFNYISAFDRENYSLLLQQLSELLHREGLYLMLSSAPRIFENNADNSSAGLDYEAANSFCDRVLLQCYNWGHGSCAPQSVSPMPRILQSLEYALRFISPEKLLLGISDHGYRWKLPWKLGETADAVSNDVAQALAVSNAEYIKVDRLSQTPFFCFNASDRKRYLVYFDDAASIFRKLRLIEEYSLAGAALFCSYQPSPMFLYLLQQMFNPEKLF